MIMAGSEHTYVPASWQVSELEADQMQLCQDPTSPAHISDHVNDKNKYQFCFSF